MSCLGDVWGWFEGLVFRGNRRWCPSARQSRELGLSDLGQRPTLVHFPENLFLVFGMTLGARGMVPLPRLGGLGVLRARDWS